MSVLKRLSSAGGDPTEASNKAVAAEALEYPEILDEVATGLTLDNPKSAHKLAKGCPRDRGRTWPDVAHRLAMGLGDDPRVQQAVEHLVSLVDDNGWRCRADAKLGKFRGPGRKEDPCPIASVYALKALSLVPEMVDSPATRAGAEMLLSHWEKRGERKIYLAFLPRQPAGQTL